MQNDILARNTKTGLFFNGANFSADAAGAKRLPDEPGVRAVLAGMFDNVEFTPAEGISFWDHITRYGTDFLKKCRNYSTARHGNEFVSLRHWDENNFTFRVQYIGGREARVHVSELTDFVL